MANENRSVCQACLAESYGKKRKKIDPSTGARGESINSRTKMEVGEKEERIEKRQGLFNPNLFSLAKSIHPGDWDEYRRIGICWRVLSGSGLEGMNHFE